MPAKEQKSLWQSYSKIQKSYYDINVHCNKLFKGNNDEVEKNCLSFIEQHYREGKKNRVSDHFMMDGKIKDNLLSSKKPAHTVSLYLLGLCMKSSFENEVLSALKQIIVEVKTWYEFEYTWFLTSLYHDMASCEESLLPEHETSLKLENDFKTCEYTIFDHVLVSGNKFIPRYPEVLINRYYEYQKEKGELDHGIVAGYILFDALVKNFNEKTKNHSFQSGCVIIENLEWRKEHLDHFAYIADAIICHNIWTTYEYEKKSLEYEKSDLIDLIIKSKKDRLTFKQSPLQFLLYLLDTIEPVKKFENLDASAVLKKIWVSAGMDESRHHCRIVIGWDRTLEDEDKFLNWKDSIVKMGKWLDLKVKEKKEKYAQLIIKFESNFQ